MYNITICNAKCPYKQENGTFVSYKMCVHSILANQATAATFVRIVTT